MNDDLLTHKPKTEALDYAYAIVKGIISTVPIAGDVAAEVLTLIVASPLEKRREEWIDSMTQGLVDLQEQLDEFKLECLSDKESFITTVMQASQAAIRNHQKEKLEALRNAVLNSALPSAPEDDLQLIFINLVDELTAWHIRVLKLYDDPLRWAEENEKTFPTNWHMRPATHVLEHAYPDLVRNPDLYKKIFQDLDNYGLLSVPSAMMTVQGVFASRTAAMGKQFLRFIHDPRTSDN